MALSDYSGIESSLCVTLTIDEYRVSPNDAPVAQVLRFSDNIRTVTIDTFEYRGLGNLMGITASVSEISTSAGTVTMTLSGIPNSSIAEILHSSIKGSLIDIKRALFYPNGDLLPEPSNPFGRFRGIVNNYSLTEDWDEYSRTSSNVLTLTCANLVEVLNNKVSGRATNPTDEKRFYPTDLSMDRVPNLENAAFNFGVK